MISHRLQSTPITDYYEYLSRHRHRVNVAPGEGSMTEPETTINSNSSTAPSTINDDHAVSVIDAQNNKDVTQWSSAEVQHWIEEQCQKFELKKATTEKFQLNGQALVLLTKHDFLRRSPDGGEILYYALQRMIKPNKTNSVRNGSNFTRNGSTRQSTRITEIGSDTDEHNSASNSPSSSQPIIEEPDDPPLQRKSDSDPSTDNFSHQRYPRSYFRSHAHMHQPVFTGPTAAYYYPQQQQPPPQAQIYPNTYVYAQQQQQQYYHHPQAHVHFLHQYQPMMAAQGILIEFIDREEAKNLLANGASSSLNDNSNNIMNIDAIPGQLYLITVNGQRYIMNEEQLRYYANEFQQQQMFHHQQHFQQQYQYQQQRQTSQDNIFHTTS